MILRKLKRLLGMGSESDESGRSERDDIVVDDGSSEADAETEAAVKGVDEASSESATETAEPEAEPTESEEDADVGAGDVDEPVATDTDAAASTESLVDEAEATEHAESRAEPAEAAGPGADAETTDVAEADTGTTDVAEADAETDAAEEEADTTAEEADTDVEPEDGTDVDEIKGIGPAYSERLGEVGIQNVAQLAEADAANLAEDIAVAEGTVQKWIDRAQEFED